MLTDKELNQIRAIVRQEIHGACRALAAAIDSGLDERFGPLDPDETDDPGEPVPSGDVGPVFEPGGLRARLERMNDIDRRNDERIDAWKASREGAGK